MCGPEYRPLGTGTGQPKASICRRLHLVKAFLVIGSVLTILNIIYGFDIKLSKLSLLGGNSSQSASAPSSYLPKRLHPVFRGTQNATAPDGVETGSATQLPNRADKSLSLPPPVPGNYSLPEEIEAILKQNESVAFNDTGSSTNRVPNEPVKDENLNLDEHLTNSTYTESSTTGFFTRMMVSTEMTKGAGEQRPNIKTDDDDHLISTPPSTSADELSGAQTKFSGYIQTSSAHSVTFLSKLMTTLHLNACPDSPPDLHGPLEVDTSADTMENVEKHLKSHLLPGGWFRPIECNAKDRVAIIIPYRNRPEHLPILLKNLHPMLMRQQVNYGIFVVEETQADPFNRASLMNVGVLEANKMESWDCFIFHDVDLIPLDDRNLYRCPEQPRHMSVAIDVFDYKLPYFFLFGGVSALTKEQFFTVNGFSNLFWGWGGEDDDMSNRIRFMGYHISRYPVSVARYTMLSHAKAQPNPKRYEKLQNGLKRFESDGLNSVKYEIVDNKKFPMFTWLLVKLKPEMAIGKPDFEKNNENPFLKYFLLILLSTLLLCIFKALFF